MYTKKESDFASNYHLQPIFKEDQTLNWFAICKILPKLCSLLVHSTLLKHVNTYENMFDSCPFSHGLLPPVPFHISFVGDLRSVLFPQLGFRAGPAAPWVNDALMVKQLNTWWLHNFGRHPHHLNISFRRKTTSIRLSICTWKFTILQPSTLPGPWVGQLVPLEVKLRPLRFKSSCKPSNMKSMNSSELELIFLLETPSFLPWISMYTREIVMSNHDVSTKLENTIFFNDIVIETTIWRIRSPDTNTYQTYSLVNFPSHPTTPPSHLLRIVLFISRELWSKLVNGSFQVPWAHNRTSGVFRLF